MIKIFKKLKRRNSNKNSRKNPYLQSNAKKILSNLDPNNKINFTFIGEGSFGETYLFEISQNKLFQNIILKPGKYILKVFKENERELVELPSTSEIKYFNKLSKYGLIPEIYVMTKEFNIMKYIEGITFCHYFENNISPNIDKIVTNIEKLIQTWHKLGFAHGDLACSNILISKSNKVFFIDPYSEIQQSFDDSFNEDLDWLKRYKGLLK